MYAVSVLRRTLEGLGFSGMFVMAASIHYSGSRDVICILDYKGKRVLMHQLLPEGMKKSVCVFMLVENGVALSISCC